jgi:phytoene/squalene synthetase
MADARVAEVRRLIDGLRRDRRQHPYHGRGEYSDRARKVAGAIADMIESGAAANAENLKSFADLTEEPGELAEDQRPVAAAGHLVQVAEQGVDLGRGQGRMVLVDQAGVQAQLTQ